MKTSWALRAPAGCCFCRSIPIGFHVPHGGGKKHGGIRARDGTARGTHADPEDRRAALRLLPAASRRARARAALSAGRLGTIRNGRTGVRSARALAIHDHATRACPGENSNLSARPQRAIKRTAVYYGSLPRRPRRVTVARARGLITAARGRRRVMAAPRRLFYAEVDCCGAARPANRAGL